MDFEVDQSTIEAAQKIAPVIQQHRKEAERERRLSRPVLEALYETGLLRMSTPRSLGGLETDPITRARVVEEISGLDTAAGWTLGNPLDWAHLCARLPDAGVEEIYQNGPDILIAAQFGRPVNATTAGGGYRISGRAPFVSNCLDADWVAMTATVVDPSQGPDAEPEMRMVYFPRESCEIIDTWDVMGMRGTGSHDVAVADVYVPKTRTFPMEPEFEPGSHYHGPLYRFPLIGVAATNLPTLMLGVARKAIDEVTALAKTKTPVARSALLKDHPSTQSRLAKAEAVFRSGRLLFYDQMIQTWRASQAGKTHTMTERADLLLAMTHAVNSAVEAVELVCRVAGTSAFRATNPLERYFRDIQVMKHHAFASESRYETVGQVLLGLPPDFSVIAF